MAQRVDMPSLGQTTDELLILEWFKREGDPVALGEPLLSVETDKAQVDVESVAAGTLLQILHEAGETVQAGSPIAYIGAPGEPLPDVPGVGEKPGIAGPAHSATAAATPHVPPRGPAPSVPAGRVAALPAARRRAGELGVDLAAVAGTGPDGVITLRDVDRAGAAAAAPTDPDLLEVPPPRQVIARRMSASAQQIPQFTLTVSVDAGAARDLIGREGAGLTYTHLIVRAVAAALRGFPAVNRLWVEEGPRYRQLRRSDVGLAVACADGLRVVSIPEPDRALPGELASLVGTAASRARSGSLLPVDRQPAAVAVSNLGMHGVEQFQALVDPDQTAVLAVGSVEERPVVRDGAVAILPMLRISLSIDHRVVDGVHAAQFLQAVKTALESPDGAG